MRLQNYEDRLANIAGISMNYYENIHQSIIDHLGVDVGKSAGLQIDNAHTGSPEYHVTDLHTGEESKYITHNGAYLAMAGIVKRHKLNKR